MRDGGRCCFIGISDVETVAHVPITHVVRRRISLVGSYGARASPTAGAARDCRAGWRRPSRRHHAPFRPGGGGRGLLAAQGAQDYRPRHRALPVEWKEYHVDGPPKLRRFGLPLAFSIEGRMVRVYDEQQLLAVVSDPSKLRSLLLELIPPDSEFLEYWSEAPNLMLAAAYSASHSGLVDDPSMGDYDQLVTELLRNSSNSVDDTHPWDGTIALSWAAHSNNVKVITALLDAGASIRNAPTMATLRSHGQHWSKLRSRAAAAQSRRETDLVNRSGRTALVISNDCGSRARARTRSRVCSSSAVCSSCAPRRTHAHGSSTTGRWPCPSCQTRVSACSSPTSSSAAFDRRACRPTRCVTLVEAAGRERRGCGVQHERARNHRRQHGVAAVRLVAPRNPRRDADEVAPSRRCGRDALRAASLADCMLLARPGQAALSKEWLGSLLYMLGLALGKIISRMTDTL